MVGDLGTLSFVSQEVRSWISKKLRAGGKVLWSKG